jgi:hypothetical protein
MLGFWSQTARRDIVWVIFWVIGSSLRVIVWVIGSRDLEIVWVIVWVIEYRKIIWIIVWVVSRTTKG